MDNTGKFLRGEDTSRSRVALDAIRPRFFCFLRESVGTGKIKGSHEGWVAPAALYTAPQGIGESSWTTTTETVLAIRLRGGVVEDHNRKAIRKSGPRREFALQPKGSSTRFLCFNTLEFGHVFLADSLLDRACHADGHSPLSGRLRDDLSFVSEDRIQTLIRDYLRRAFDTVVPPTTLEMEGRALLLVDALQRLHETPRGYATEPRGGLSAKHLRLVCDFITEHLSESIYLDDLAGLTGLSCKHFLRAFRQSTGLPPHRYLIMRRIEAAKRYLLNDKAVLADIAIKSGFADQSHFAATFRRVAGVPPSVWRAKAR